MREIEVKASISNKESLINTLTKAGVQLTSPIKQHDVVYGQKGIADNAPGSIWLRIRTENDSKVLFTLKQQHSGGLDSIEHETEVSSASETEAIIAILNFELFSDLTKYRQKANYKGIEICVDDVEGLGAFIEAEKLTDVSADGTIVVEQLWVLLEGLGVDRSSEVFEGYDVLMNKKLAG